jgi:hypothetical protein
MSERTAEEMVDWFHDHFEDPANRLYHGEGEDGYEWGGYTPHYPPDVLAEEFPDASASERDKAARELQRGAIHWLRRSEL